MGDVSRGHHKRKVEDKPSKMMKKKWTPNEDAVLIAALAELCNAGWKRENGIYRSGYTAALERKLKSRLPGCNIKASPHIESRLKLLKRQYDAITETQGAVGIRWDSKENILRCDDDNVWEDWIQTHADAKGLRNKQFPHYKDLHFLFGNRSTRKVLNNEFDDNDDAEGENNGITHMIVKDSFEEDDSENTFQNASFGKEVNQRVDNDGVAIGKTDSLIEQYKKRKLQGDIVVNTLDYSMLPDHDGTRDRSEDSARTNKSDGDNTSADGTVRTEVQPRASTTDELNEKSSNVDGSSELGELAKIFGAFLNKYQEHLSLLSEILRRENMSEKTAAEKRATLNLELKKLPNLSLQARLRAASMIVSDPAKLDLFYSLCEEERREWVSMLLTGSI